MFSDQVSPSLIEALQQVVERRPDNYILRRVEVLLDLTAGKTVSTVAREHQVSRQTLYSWIHRIQGWDGVSRLEQQLGDRPREGRPASKRDAVIGMIGQLVQSSPMDFGYQSRGWTSRLLQQHLRDREYIQVSVITIRRCLQRLAMRLQDSESTNL